MYETKSLRPNYKYMYFDVPYQIHRKTNVYQVCVYVSPNTRVFL